MDSIFTILLYIGGLLLIGLIKSISKSGKNKTFHTTIGLDASNDFTETNPFSSFLTKEPVVSTQTTKLETSILPALKAVQNTENKYIKEEEYADSSFPEDRNRFILGDFDVRTAIIYSEIFKRPDY